MVDFMDGKNCGADGLWATVWNVEKAESPVNKGCGAIMYRTGKDLSILA